MQSNSGCLWVALGLAEKEEWEKFLDDGNALSLIDYRWMDAFFKTHATVHLNYVHPLRILQQIKLFKQNHAPKNRRRQSVSGCGIMKHLKRFLCFLFCLNAYM